MPLDLSPTPDFMKKFGKSSGKSAPSGKKSKGGGKASRLAELMKKLKK